MSNDCLKIDLISGLLRQQKNSWYSLIVIELAAVITTQWRNLATLQSGKLSLKSTYFDGAGTLRLGRGLSGGGKPTEPNHDTS